MMSYVSRAQSREHKWELRTRAFFALAIFTIVAATGCTVKSPKVPKIDSKGVKLRPKIDPKRL